MIGSMDVQAELIDFFRAFATAERIAIAGALIPYGPLTVPELAEQTGIKEMQILRHCAVLEETGLIHSDERGRYTFANDQLKSLNKTIWRSVTPAKPKLDPDSDEAVLARYVKDGRLNDIPAKLSKQVIILKWIVKQLDPQKAYLESELNDVLAEFHPDVASLRRFMVDEQLMMRLDGVYWVTDE